MPMLSDFLLGAVLAVPGLLKLSIISVVVVVVGDVNISKKLPPPPIDEFRSSMLVLPETLLIPVLSSLACNAAPQLKHMDSVGMASSTTLVPPAPPLFFITVAGAPQFGHIPFTVYSFDHTWKPTVARIGREIASTKNELNIPKTNPPSGETKNPTVRRSVPTLLAISAMSFLSPPPPFPGGRLYIDRLVLVFVVDDDQHCSCSLRIP
mmetsp:Transcript_1007/g.2326  ORF Transcript_1007/g.2326 Transcript_1007/m.2326 type:complete len:208 (+) Transcript_1007:1289-1912(+)